MHIQTHACTLALALLIAGTQLGVAGARASDLDDFEQVLTIPLDEVMPGGFTDAISTSNSGRTPQICRCWLGNYEIVRTWTTSRAACNKKGQRTAKSYRAANPRRFGNAPLTCRWGGTSLLQH